MNKIKLFFNEFYNSRTENNEERIRVTVFLMGMLLSLIGDAIHIFGVVGLLDPRLQAITYCKLMLVICCSSLFFSRCYSIKSCFFIYGVVAQLLQSIRIVLLPIWYPTGAEEAMMANLIISYTLLLYLTMGFMALASYIVAGLFLLSMTIALLLCGDGTCMNPRLWVIFTCIEIMTCILSYIENKAMMGIKKVSSERQDQIIAMNSTFGLSDKDMRIFLSLREDPKRGDKAAAFFFDHIDHESERRLMAAVEKHKVDVMLRNKSLSERFPMLTDTELKVALHVMEGKSLKEIACLLDKSENNVGSVRVNIRKKLQLSTEQDLREYLLG